MGSDHFHLVVDTEDAGLQKNLIPIQSSGVAGTVYSLMMLVDDFR
jgi:hypothetical protein